MEDKSTNVRSAFALDHSQFLWKQIVTLNFVLSSEQYSYLILREIKSVLSLESEFAQISQKNLAILSFPKAINIILMSQHLLR